MSRRARACELGLPSVAARTLKSHVKQPQAEAPGSLLEDDSEERECAVQGDLAVLVEPSPPPRD